MDPNTLRLMQGSAGAGAKLYVEDVFSTWLYTGNGSTQTITNGIDLSGKGGMVWMKSRSAATQHRVLDTERGLANAIGTSSTAAQAASTPSIFDSYNSNGFTLGANALANDSGATYASWTFRKQAKFFDIVTYVGNGGINPVSHSLGSIPGFIIIKKTSDSGNWAIAARYPSATNGFISGLSLNSTSAALGSGFWPGAGAITSTTFNPASISDHALNQMNDNGSTYVAYLFAHDAGGFGDTGNDSIIKCGSFTTPPSGLFGGLNLGWEPQWLLVKDASQIGTWQIYDTMRGWTYGTDTKYLEANSSGAELSQNGLYFSPSATGIAETANWFGGSRTLIYIAIRRGPMKTPTDATKVFDADIDNAGSTLISTGFPVDLALFKNRDNAIDNYWADRLRGSTTAEFRYLRSGSTAAEGTFSGSGVGFQSNTSLQNTWTNGPSSTVFYNFRRAPGFFDVVAYTGTGSATTVSHNLGVAPELMIVKRRSTSGTDWSTYVASLGNDKEVNLNLDLFSGSSGAWNNTTPTSSVFSLGSLSSVNANGSTYIAYLFASCPGVSKVGSYTGTGTTLSVDCGFTAGARFVLIKRTDSTGNWYVWDSARGIVAGNDPYLLLNSTAAEVTNTDYVDTYSAGFQISSTAPAAINANGGSFIFLAVA